MRCTILSIMPFLKPLMAGQSPLGEAWDRIEASPDFVMVEVVSDREQIRVEKNGRNLRILVDGKDVDVDISVPLRTVDRLLRKL